MRQMLIAITLAAGVLAGCVSHDGTYAPGCIAFAGSRITLADGDFVWEKFTDEVILNDAGEVVDQFPGYPLRGSYRIDGETVLMTSDAGRAMENMYLHRREGKSYLYTRQQFEHWQTTAEHAECALVLDKNSDAGK